MAPSLFALEVLFARPKLAEENCMFLFQCLGTLLCGQGTLELLLDDGFCMLRQPSRQRRQCGSCGRAHGQLGGKRTTRRQTIDKAQLAATGERGFISWDGSNELSCFQSSRLFEQPDR